MKKKINFDNEVENLDKEWSEAGITSDAEDMFESLTLIHGGLHKKAIKKAIEEFYQITLKV
jgi:hypothetical protein